MQDLVVATGGLSREKSCSDEQMRKRARLTAE